MQLNPARGRKPASFRSMQPSIISRVYAAQPREGTETCVLRDVFQIVKANRFMQLNPARGRKQSLPASQQVPISPVYAAQPREGTETPTLACRDLARPSMRFMQLNPARGRKRVRGRRDCAVAAPGLCSSTPRGDGNSSRTRAL